MCNVSNPSDSQPQGPCTLTLEPGVYAWCTCGLVQESPFCNGAHRGTHFRPSIFHVTEQPEKVTLCMCKQTKTPPFCDGSHAIK